MWTSFIDTPASVLEDCSLAHELTSQTFYPIRFDSQLKNLCDNANAEFLRDAWLPLPTSYYHLQVLQYFIPLSQSGKFFCITPTILARFPIPT